MYLPRPVNLRSVVHALQNNVSCPWRKETEVLESNIRESTYNDIVHIRDVSDAEISRSADADAYANICA